MTRRRVVVTGLGCISPVGNNVQDSWNNLLAGQSGVAGFTRLFGLAAHVSGARDHLVQGLL